MYNIKPLIIATTVSAGLLLGGCQTTQEEQGRVIGAIAGGVLGSRVGGGSGKIAATIAGTVIGGYIGGKLGREMDENDRYRAQQALEDTRTGETTHWDNPDNGHEYAVTPTRTYYNQSQPCREYTTEAWIDGKKQTVYGTACRQADGSWQAASN